MSFPEFLPHLNATFNSLSACCLITGFVAVRRKRITLHSRCMITAFVFSALFLFFYLLRWYLVGHVEFPGPDGMRMIYLPLLISHVSLAIPILPLSITLIILGVSGRIDRHRRMARWTLPIWLYVSVTGVIVYVFLYRIY